MEHLSYKENWSCSAWRRAGSGKTFFAAFQYLKGAYKKDGDKFFGRAC